MTTITQADIDLLRDVVMRTLGETLALLPDPGDSRTGPAVAIVAKFGAVLDLAQQHISAPGHSRLPEAIRVLQLDADLIRPLSWRGSPRALTIGSDGLMYQIGRGSPCSPWIPTADELCELYERTTIGEMEKELKTRGG